jgi:hypothetical protein
MHFRFRQSYARYDYLHIFSAYLLGQGVIGTLCLAGKDRDTCIPCFASHGAL